MPIPHSSAVINNYNATLLGIIGHCALGANLNFVLDAADLRSYDGSSQTWTDATGNANNFFRGTTSGADATDPTFNGTAGLPTEGTYFSFDGGDYFTETAAHTFADNWHKDNGALSIVALVYPGNATTNQELFSNENGTDGIDVLINSTGNLVFGHATNNTTREAILSSANYSATAWNFIGVSFIEATPAVVLRINTAAETPAVSASTATDANSQVLRIAARGDATLPLTSGSRLACIAGWSTAIGATGLANLYTVLKARRFTSLP